MPVKSPGSLPFQSLGLDRLDFCSYNILASFRPSFETQEKKMSLVVAFAPTVDSIPGADFATSHTWERTGCPLGGACPEVVAHSNPSSTGGIHDIVLNDVNKCQPFQLPTPAATLLERRKNKLNVAKCGSRGARFRVAPRRVACWLQAKSRVHVGNLWGTSPFIPHSALRISQMWGNVGVFSVTPSRTPAPEQPLQACESQRAVNYLADNPCLRSLGPALLT
jgi:hypothetical protein